MMRVVSILGVALLASVWGAAELVAGVHAVDITPPPGGMMAGYGDRGILCSTGVHDPLMAKALVLRDDDTALAIVTMDLCGVPSKIVPSVKATILDRTGIDHIMLLASHTHSGPDDNPRFPSADEPYVKDLEAKIVDAVAAASGSLVPVRYGVGQGEAREGHNRRKVLPDGTCEMFWRNEECVSTEPADYGVGVVRFEKQDGSPLATLVNFACHPVILGPENLEISADWPGAMAHFVEAKLGGVCMFAQGACGDINPYMDKSDPKEGAFDEVERMGRVLADEVIRVSKSVTAGDAADVKLTARSEAIPIALRWDLTDPEVIAAFERHYGKWLVALVKSRLEEELSGPLEGDLVTATIGDDIAFVAVPGEFFVEHGLDLKRRSAIPNTFLFGYCNKTYGYFPTINAAWQGGYGGKEATVVEVGCGEAFINRALVNLYYQAGKLHEIPQW